MSGKAEKLQWHPAFCAGLWDWLQNFYHCGSGNPLWNLYKLATWGHILDISADSEVDGKGVSHS